MDGITKLPYHFRIPRSKGIRHLTQALFALRGIITIRADQLAELFLGVDDLRDWIAAVRCQSQPRVALAKFCRAGLHDRVAPGVGTAHHFGIKRPALGCRRFQRIVETPVYAPTPEVQAIVVGAVLERAENIELCRMIALARRGEQRTRELEVVGRSAKLRAVVFALDGW